MSSAAVQSSRFRDGSRASLYRLEHASSVLPWILRAMTDHFVPWTAYNERSSWSSSEVHAVFFTLGDRE